MEEVQAKSTKSCRMCCMEIPTAARKCPHCHQYQNQLSVIMFHPAFTFAMVCIYTALFTATIGVFVHHVTDQGEDFHAYAGTIQITDCAVCFGQESQGPADPKPTVAVLGKMKNSSTMDWKDVRLQVDFVNAQGRLVDTFQERDYQGRYLPAGQELTFKVSCRRDFPQSEYATCKVGVVTAKDGRTRF